MCLDKTLLWPTFQGHDNIQPPITRLTVSRVWSVQWIRFQWPWVTLDVDFKVTEMPSTNCVHSWRAVCLRYLSSCLFVDAAVFGRSKSISKPNFVDIISIHDWDITISVFEIQTSAILEFYFRFRYRPFCRNWHVILRQATEFRPNLSTHSGNMTSYLFLKMAAAAAQYYFRFRISWSRCLQNVKIYQPTKFRQHILIIGWDITTSVFEKKRPPYWNFTSGFDIDHFAVIGVLFCTRLPNFVQIGSSTTEIWGASREKLDKNI